MSLLLIVIVQFFLIHENSAWAGADVQLGGYSRSYPLGGSVELNLGYGVALWGAEDSPWLGYLRLATDFEGDENYFSSTAKFEFFPVSFFGGRVGQSLIQNHLDYKDFDCENFLCRGRFIETFYEIPLFLAYGDFVFAGSYRVGQWKNSSDNLSDAGVMSGAKTEFIDPTSGLNLNIAEMDTVKRYRAILMMNLRALGFGHFSGTRGGSGFQIGYSETFYLAEDLDTALPGSNGANRLSHLWMGFLRYTGDAWFGSGSSRGGSGSGGSELSVTVGAGEYKSHLLQPDPTIIFSLSYAPLKKLGY